MDDSCGSSPVGLRVHHGRARLVSAIGRVLRRLAVCVLRTRPVPRSAPEHGTRSERVDRHAAIVRAVAHKWLGPN